MAIPEMAIMARRPFLSSEIFILFMSFLPKPKGSNEKSPGSRPLPNSRLAMMEMCSKMETQIRTWIKPP